MTPTLGQGVYATLDFSRHLLSVSTLLNNYGATHLVNSKELLEPGSFTKAAYNEYVEAGSSSLLILGHSKRVIKKVLNSTAGLTQKI